MEDEVRPNDFLIKNLEGELEKINLHQDVIRFIKEKILNNKKYPIWIKHDRIVYLVTVSNGYSGTSLIEHLEYCGYDIAIQAKQMMCASKYVATKNVVTVLAILDGRLFSTRGRNTRAIYRDAKKRKLKNPNAENASLIREVLTNKHLEFMGFSRIIVMHNVIKDNDHISRLFNVNRVKEKRALSAPAYDPNQLWSYDSGFAFELFSLNLD